MHPVRAYVLFTVLFGLGMGVHATVYSPFLLGIGLSLGDIALANVCFFVAVSLAELPTGMVADGKSRVWSIRAGALILACGTFGYSTAAGFGDALVWEAVLGVGMAFLSGAQQAWLADVLRNRGEDGLLAKAFGTAAFGQSLGLLAGGFIGGWLGLISLRLPWIVGGSVLLLTAAVGLLLMRADGEPPERISELAALAASVRILRRNRHLGWGAAAAVVFGLVLPFNYYWAPFFRERAGAVSVPLLWLPIFATNALAGWMIRKKGLEQGREGPGIVSAMIISGAGLAVIGIMPGIMAPLAAVMVHEYGRGLFLPILDIYTQRRTESSWRATYGSFQSLLGRGGYSVILLVLWGITADLPNTDLTISRVWLGTGCLLAVAAVALWLRRPKN